jgi:hypothetical protein
VIIGKNLKGRVIKGPAFSYVCIMSIYCKMGNLLVPSSLAIFFSFFIFNLLARVYGEKVDHPEELGKIGFRILPSGKADRFPHWDEAPLPSWSRTSRRKNGIER